MKSGLLVNLFEYGGKPFKEGLSAAVYVSREKIPHDRLYLIGQAANEIERIAGEPSSIAVQYGTKIYCVPLNPANLKKTVHLTRNGTTYRWKMESDSFVLHPKNMEHKEVIRRLVAKAITNQQLRRKWFVEAYKRVYHWSFQYSQPLSMGLLEVFPGFIFRPYIYKDGSCVVLIDPKFKFISRKNLRDIVNEMIQNGLSEEDICTVLEDEPVIDACPVIDCRMRIDPASPCRLKGAGKRRFLETLDFSKSPSKANFGNLIAYHNRICRANGKLGKIIKDNPPIALIEAGNLDRPLEFPLERLRKELKLHEINRFGRLKVMKYIRPSAKERWRLTRSFLTYVDNLPFGRYSRLRITRHFIEAGSPSKPWTNYEKFRELPLQLGEGISTVPFQGLENYGPYDVTTRLFDEIYPMLYCFSRRLSLRDVERF